MKSLLLSLLALPACGLLASQKLAVPNTIHTIKGTLSNTAESLKGVEIEFDFTIEVSHADKAIIVKDMKAELSLDDESLFNNPRVTFLMFDAKTIALHKLKPLIEGTFGAHFVDKDVLISKVICKSSSIKWHIKEIDINRIS